MLDVHAKRTLGVNSASQQKSIHLEFWSNKYSDSDRGNDVGLYGRVEGAVGGHFDNKIRFGHILLMAIVSALPLTVIMTLASSLTLN